MSKPKPKTRDPLWKGPYANGGDGITQSLISRFAECRHRFWLKTVCGLAEEEGFSRPLEFGNMWHMAEEIRLGGGDWLKALKTYRLKLDRQYPNDLDEIYKWYSVCKATFPVYLDYWSKHKDETDAQPVLEETSFAVPYALPSGRTVLLRGKWDALRLFLLPPKKRSRKCKYGIYIKEHKTKSEVDEEGILKTVARNFQTMMYQIALRTVAYGELAPCPGLSNETLKTYYDAILNYPIGGVLYNVIRRPLGGRWPEIKMKAKETQTAFYERLAETIRAESFDSNGKPRKSSYFMRWRIELEDEDIESFKQMSFHPILEQVCNWWDSIQGDPFTPFMTRKWDHGPNPPHTTKVITVPNPHHWQTPWGFYNSLAGGFRGSFFEYLTSGRDFGLRQITNLFPELT